MVSHPDVNRPALQLTGFYDQFDNERVQMLGNVEIAYLSGLGKDRRIAMYDKLLSSKIPCLVFCRNLVPETEVLDLCNTRSRVTGCPACFPRSRPPIRWRR